jgi:hypothetical protein
MTLTTPRLILREYEYEETDDQYEYAILRSEWAAQREV